LSLCAELELTVVNCSVVFVNCSVVTVPVNIHTYTQTVNEQ